MNKSVLVVYSCYNPPTSLIDSIQSLYDKQILNNTKHKIICVDNNSDIISTYDAVKEQFPNVEIIFNKNKNYEWGAYKYAYDNFSNYDLYFCLQDTIVFTKQININNITDNSPYSIFYSGGFLKLGADPFGVKVFYLKNLLSYKVLKQKNINFDDMVCEDFIMSQHNTFLITKNDLSKLFEVLINPPSNKLDSNLYERIFGLYFIKKNINRKDLTSYIKKIDREDRIFITKK